MSDRVDDPTVSPVAYTAQVGGCLSLFRLIMCQFILVLERSYVQVSESVYSTRVAIISLWYGTTACFLYFYAMIPDLVRVA